LTQAQRLRQRKRLLRKRPKVKLFDESKNNRDLVIVRMLRDYDQIAIVWGSYFSLRELIKIGTVCKRFYGITGKQELLRGNQQVIKDQEQQVFVMVPDYQYPSGMTTNPHRASNSVQHASIKRCPTELLQNGKRQAYLQAPPIDIFSLNNSDGVAD